MILILKSLVEMKSECYSFSMFVILEYNGHTIMVILIVAVIVWSNRLANDLGGFPITLKRARTEHSRACELWCQCSGDICIFPTGGA